MEKFVDVIGVDFRTASGRRDFIVGLIAIICGSAMMVDILLRWVTCSLY